MQLTNIYDYKEALKDVVDSASTNIMQTICKLSTLNGNFPRIVIAYLLERAGCEDEALDVWLTTRDTNENWVIKEYYDALFRLNSSLIDNSLLERMKELPQDGGILYRLGKSYKNGIGTDIDYLQAEKIFRKGYELGDYDCATGLYDTIWRMKDKKKDEELYEIIKSEQMTGTIKSLIYEGDMYNKGRGVPKDIEKSIELYRTSYKLDSGNYAKLFDALYRKDPSLYGKELLDLVLSPAYKGISEATSRLSLLYLGGYGVDCSYELATYWASKTEKNNEKILKSIPKFIDVLKDGMESLCKINHLDLMIKNLEKINKNVIIVIMAADDASKKYDSSVMGFFSDLIANDIEYRESIAVVVVKGEITAASRGKQSKLRYMLNNHLLCCESSGFVDINNKGFARLTIDDVVYDVSHPRGLNICILTENATILDFFTIDTYLKRMPPIERNVRMMRNEGS